MTTLHDAGLERSCAPPARDWIRTAPAQKGLERIEAHFAGHAFDRHSHDCYALGITLYGVQAFHYRGARSTSLPGHAMILHPDECHDGQAGTEEGFLYRMLYLEPARIRDALRDRAKHLPFIAMPVCDHAPLLRVLHAALGDMERPLEPLEADEVVVEIAEILLTLDRSPPRPVSASHVRAVDRARQYLDAHCARAVQAEDLERETGLDRFTLTRQFRHQLGTSPYRYLVLRRLDRARSAIRRGGSLADAAAVCGFADQSHFTRHFRRAFGLSPGRWRALSRQD